MQALESGTNCASGGSVGFLGGPTKVLLATVWLEERSDREIAIKGGEGTGFAIETADGAPDLVRFNDPIGKRSVTQILRHGQVLIERHVAKFPTMLFKVLLKFGARAKANSAQSWITSIGACRGLALGLALGLASRSRSGSRGNQGGSGFGRNSSDGSSLPLAGSG